MPNIVKRQILLSRPQPLTNTKRVLFSNADTQPWEGSTSLFLAQKDWEDMNSPEEITVTIEPGDHLNDVGQAAVDLLPEQSSRRSSYDH